MITQLERAQIRSNLRHSTLDSRWRRTVSTLLDSLDEYEETYSWIRTVKLMPEGTNEVLVLTHDPDGGISLGVASRKEGKWYDHNNNEMRANITHWMHLPPPPAEDRPWLR